MHGWANTKDSMTWPMRRLSLVTLSHAFEEAFAGTEGAADGGRVLLGLFQRADRFEVEARRYARLARRATVVVAHAGSSAPVPGVHAVSLDATDPLTREWTLVGFGPGCGAALVATERKDSFDGGPGRVFEARWTFRQAAAAMEAERVLAGLRTHLPTEVADDVQRSVDERLDRPESEAERAQARIMELLLAHVDDLHRRADSVDATQAVGP